MNQCKSCGTDNLDSSQYCDECGARLVRPENVPPPTPHDFVSASYGNSGTRPANITSVGIPPLVAENPSTEMAAPGETGNNSPVSHASLTIERGDSANTIFSLSAEESYIGRWDADNGIFPDVDLDPYDPDAKVSRKHARIIFRNNVYMVEDLGSTNGTFVNRGRRLLPGSPQVLAEGDEIIVGKTFLRFHINN